MAGDGATHPLTAATRIRWDLRVEDKEVSKMITCTRILGKRGKSPGVEAQAGCPRQRMRFGR